MNKKQVENWYGYLSESPKKCSKKIINEISTSTLNKFKFQRAMDKASKDPSSLPFEHLFKGKLRIVIPMVKDSGDTQDAEMLKYLGEIKTKLGWNINLQEPFGYATKIVQSTVGDKVYNNKKRVKIGPLFKELGPEAEEFWVKHAKFYTTKENELYFATDYSIILSRAPMDILRMSDMDDWSSCHSQDGSYFICAVDEATHGGGIAYVVQTKKLQDIGLQDSEIFSDSNRRIPGIQPISRLRIRRIVSRDDETEVGIPELRVYGQSVPGFKKQVMEYLREKQGFFLEDIIEKGGINLSDWEIWGGSYQDNTVTDILYTFTGLDDDKFRFHGSPRARYGFNRNFELEEDISELTTIYNQRYNHTAVYAELNEDDDYDGHYEASYTYGGKIIIEFPIDMVDKSTTYLSNYELQMIKEDFSVGEVSYQLQNISEITISRETVVNIHGEKRVVTTFNLNFEDDTSTSINELRNFIDELREYESEYEDIKAILQHSLQNLGYLDTNYDLSELEELKYFEFKETPKKIEVTLKDTPMLFNDAFANKTFDNMNIAGTYLPTLKSNWVKEINQKYDEFEMIILNKQIHDKIIKAFKNSSEYISKQRSMFGEEEYTTENGGELPERMDITSWFNYNHSKNASREELGLVFSIEMNLNIENSKQDYEIFIEFVKYMDANLQHIVNLTRELLTDVREREEATFLEKIKNHINPEIRKAFFKQNAWHDNSNGQQRLPENKIWKLSDKNWKRIK